MWGEAFSSLLVACYFLLYTCYFSLVTHNCLLVTRNYLLVTRNFLLVNFYFLLATCYIFACYLSVLPRYLLLFTRYKISLTFSSLSIFTKNLKSWSSAVKFGFAFSLQLTSFGEMWIKWLVFTGLFLLITILTDLYLLSTFSSTDQYLQPPLFIAAIYSCFFIK